MEFIHTYLGYNNNRDEYNCEILNEIKNPVGFCKYYKSNSYDSQFISLDFAYEYNSHDIKFILPLYE